VRGRSSIGDFKTLSCKFGEAELREYQHKTEKTRLAIVEAIDPTLARLRDLQAR
jgi:hypothetical protein